MILLVFELGNGAGLARILNGREVFPLDQLLEIKRQLLRGVVRHITIIYYVFTLYNLPEVIEMKGPVFVLNESHTPSFKIGDKVVYQIVTAWLTKELQKCRN